MYAQLLPATVRDDKMSTSAGVLLGKSVWRRESKHVPPVSAPDFALDPESAERRMSDGKRRPPPLSDSLFHQPLPPAGKPADIVVPLLGPNNDAPPTLVNTSS